MGSNSSKRQANEAAERSNQEADRLRQQQTVLADRAAKESKRAQRILFRSIRARGQGVFETDANSVGGGTSNLGGAETLG